MHRAVYEEVHRLLQKHAIAEDAVVLDVGSLNVNGTYRRLFKTQHYIGVDMAPVNNVDVVMPDEFSLPFEDSFADLVVCGSCLEHCRNPHRLTAEMFRVLKPSCRIIVNAPAVWPVHNHPIDCFRFFPDGMRAVLELAGFADVETYLSGEDPKFVDCHGTGIKKHERE